jgi:hypothetical protein
MSWQKICAYLNCCRKPKTTEGAVVRANSTTHNNAVIIPKKITVQSQPVYSLDDWQIAVSEQITVLTPGPGC